MSDRAARNWRDTNDRVALVGATVVVANPVSTPQSADCIPALKLSAGSITSKAALDQALLDAIAQGPAPTSPLALPSTIVNAIRTEVRTQLTELVDRPRWAVQPPLVAGVAGPPPRIRGRDQGGGARRLDPTGRL
ncbi:hypothetical protein MSAR_29050 [Mycolicibacterium sarraceniae]|uniref:Uncharacterized protein n=1 Tax=Mycolicibacterium sarraceniae TaxID=1534348 RepID=A0A7I7SUA2_9MYCO|nr:hypothetical protein MSAR_29050 [Mycolicibacterium sarraceniae]